MQVFRMTTICLYVKNKGNQKVMRNFFSLRLFLLSSFSSFGLGSTLPMLENYITKKNLKRDLFWSCLQREKLYFDFFL